MGDLDGTKKMTPFQSLFANIVLHTSKIILPFCAFATTLLFTLPSRQQRITLKDFFDHVFDKLRPKQSGFLPCIYRKQIQANGELVAAGSSLALQLKQQNYDNISKATGPVKAMLEDHLEATEDVVAPHLQPDLHRVRTVKPPNKACWRKIPLSNPS